MALFQRKNKKEEAIPIPKESKKIKVKEDMEIREHKTLPSKIFNGDAIIRPRITEKSGMLSAKNTYTFDVIKGANKQRVKKEISRIYNVNPIYVRFVMVPPKRIFYRG